MPWKEIRPMDERVRFIGRLMDGDRMSELCREFGISRKTGYKFLERYKKFGTGGLGDQSRRPIRVARKTDERIEQQILNLKSVRPSWGPKKLKAQLERLYPGVVFPVTSTIGEILERNGLVKKRRDRSIEQRLFPVEVAETINPNEIWCVDFKGQFKLGDGHYCFPLTITDHFSRFLLGCDALSGTNTLPVVQVLEAIFDEYGLPNTIRSDNGPPFAAPRGLGGLSRLSAWWMSLGIRPDRIEPGKPQQNGRHERMHLTLKTETTRPARQNLLQQQEVFDQFRQDFNFNRPHEALNMEYPANHYRRSTRTLTEASKELEYPLCDFTRIVHYNGTIPLWKRKRCYLSTALNGLTLGLRQLSDETFAVYLGRFELGFINTDTLQYLSDNPLTTKEE